MIMGQNDVERLGKDVWGLASEINQFELMKGKKRHEIADYEAEIKKLKEGGNYVPKQLWTLENQLANKIRERDALADRIRRMQADLRRGKENLTRVKQENMRKELEMKRPRKIGRR